MTATITRTAAGAAAVGLAGTALFQVALAGGVPWGAAAWGGLYEQLPAQLRVSSAISAVVLLAAAVLVLRRAGLWGSPSRPVRVLSWVLVPLLALSALGNFASASRWENLLMGPVALLLSVLCVVVARSRPTPAAAADHTPAAV
ncbi:hypothetical protein [Lacisediminihabitans profunda]|uniref:Uncharacterized protein n=1 Tax=Lacisediminihabitans profunda TaxID=2594790 RepID=A0A5C8UHS1_9MICO|nr:hypothetical protein [Lacisediminihabitans profunda]TXN27756.1 hypothetical protein FVP33_18890 [Lacisediminihabitans profunda]